MVDNLQANRLASVIYDKQGVALDVLVHEMIESTNSWCLQQSKAGRLLPFACFAEQQTAGRGRRGKSWLMPAHSNIALSLSWPYILSEQPIHLLPLSIAVAITQTLEQLGIKQVQIKWPNDVYVQGKKIAGILIETQPVNREQVAGHAAEGSYVAVVIGVGLNYDVQNDSSLMDELLQITDVSEQVLLQKISCKPERTVIAGELLNRLVSVCRDFTLSSAQSLQAFRRCYDFCEHKQVNVILDNGNTVTGVAKGVTDNAELLVMIDGKQRVFNSADVSVRAGSE